MEALKHWLGLDDPGYHARRGIIHENKNEAQKSIASARTLRRASDESLKVAQCAINTLEKSHNKKGGENGG